MENYLNILATLLSLQMQESEDSENKSVQIVKRKIKTSNCNKKYSNNENRHSRNSRQIKQKSYSRLE